MQKFQNYVILHFYIEDFTNKARDAKEKKEKDPFKKIRKEWKR